MFIEMMLMTAGPPTLTDRHHVRQPRSTRIARCISWGGDHPSGHTEQTGFLQRPDPSCQGTVCTQRCRYWEQGLRVSKWLAFRRPPLLVFAIEGAAKTYSNWLSE